MNVPDKNWARWTFASVSVFFEARRQGLRLFIEGQHRDTRLEEDFLELRVDGPTLRQVSKGCWKLRIEVNVLVQSVFNDVNYHRVKQNSGIAQAAFETSIPVYRFGDGPDDDQSFVGCYILQQDKRSRDFIELNDFGRIEKDVPISQATVEGHYVMTLDT